MNRFPRLRVACPLHVPAALLLALAPACGPATPSANPISGVAEEIIALGTVPHKALCNAAPGLMHCHARVRTDAAGNVLAGTTPAGLSRSQLLSAYQLPTAGGSGMTVAVVDAMDDPNAESDLAVYRQYYGLPPCTSANGCFKKINQQGQAGPYPSPDMGWAGEISLDIQTVSAVCPSCRILLVEADTATYADIGAAENEAVAMGASVVSNSYGGAEDPTDPSLESAYFHHPGVGIFASAGDQGYGPEFPASSQFVTAVGGTTLAHASTARGWVESVWGGGSSSGGTGSGCSAQISKPSWQTDRGCSSRTIADVSADADPVSGLAVYDSYGGGGWIQVGGTSLSAPLVASAYALTGHADASGALSWAHPGAFYDVTSGSNGSCGGSYLCTAGVGYDGPTGNGTPNGGLLAQVFTVTAPASLTVPTTGSASLPVATALIAGAPSAVMLVAGALPAGLTASFAPAAVAPGAGATLTLAASGAATGTFTFAFDAKGASRTVTTSVTVTLVPPVSFTGVPSNQIVEATSSAGTAVSWSGPIGTLNGASVPVSCSPESGSTFPMGTTEVTCTASGVVGAQFTVKVQDTTPPVFSGPAVIDAQAGGGSGVIVTFPVTATDAVDGARDVTCWPTSGSLFPVGTTAVSCSASDTRGNASTFTFNVVVAPQSSPSAASSSGKTSPTASSGCSAGGGTETSGLWALAALGAAVARRRATGR